MTVRIFMKLFYLKRIRLLTIALIIHASLIGLDLRNISNLDEWAILQKSPVKIELSDYEGFPICKAETILNYNLESIASAIQNLDDYPNIFKRITKAHRVKNNIVHIALDMPFPFSGRDYIIKYTINKNKDTWIFSFSAVNNPDVELIDDHVRLPNAAGIWILNSLSSKKTHIIYAWNGELLGNFPDFGLEKAWITQGTEVLDWLDQSLSNKLKP